MIAGACSSRTRCNAPDSTSPASTGTSARPLASLLDGRHRVIEAAGRTAAHGNARFGGRAAVGSRLHRSAGGLGVAPLRLENAHHPNRVVAPFRRDDTMADRIAVGSDNVKISVFGMGYVGVVAAGCLAEDGHQVVGVDPNPTKVDLINRGVTPIVEKDIGEIVERNVAAGRLSATADVRAAVLDSDLSLICVGTPSQLQRRTRPELRAQGLRGDRRGAARQRAPSIVVVVRSTMLPGTMRDVVIPTLEDASGKKAGVDFGVCNNPEFLREGTAVHDYCHPPKTVIGETDARSGDLLASLYAGLDAPLIRTDVETAEMVKYVDNVWHALKVVVRQRDRQHLQAARHRQPRGDGHLLPGHEAQPLALLPEAGLRVRRLVPAQGRARAELQGADARPRPAAAQRDPAQQRAPARARLQR